MDDDFLKSTGEERTLNGRGFPLTNVHVEAALAAERQVVEAIRQLT